jgi:hypothetical protein
VELEVLKKDKQNIYHHVPVERTQPYGWGQSPAQGERKRASSKKTNDWPTALFIFDILIQNKKTAEINTRVCRQV